MTKLNIDWIYEDISSIDPRYDEQCERISELLPQLINEINHGDINDQQTLHELEEFFTSIKNTLKGTSNNSFSIGGNFRAHQSGFIIKIETNNWHHGSQYNTYPFAIQVKVGGANPSALKTALCKFIESNLSRLYINDKSVSVSYDYYTNFSTVTVRSPYIDGDYRKVSSVEFLKNI